MLDDGLAWFAERIAASASTQVKYCRGASSITINVVPMRQPTAVVSTAGPAIDPAKSEREFSINLDDIYSFLGGTMPVQGDFLVETVRGVPRIYRISAPSVGGQWWRWETGRRAANARIIVNTKESTYIAGSANVVGAVGTVLASGTSYIAGSANVVGAVGTVLASGTSA